MREWKEAEVYGTSGPKRFVPYDFGAVGGGFTVIRWIGRGKSGQNRCRDSRACARDTVHAAHCRHRSRSDRRKSQTADEPRSAYFPTTTRTADKRDCRERVDF